MYSLKKIELVVQQMLGNLIFFTCYILKIGPYFAFQFICTFFCEYTTWTNIFEHSFMSNLHEQIYSDIHLLKKNYIRYTLYCTKLKCTVHRFSAIYCNSLYITALHCNELCRT